MNGGVYTLLVRLDAVAEITVGALGDHRFDGGWYAYTGSALGPGGFDRVDRHRRLAAGEHDARHWHVDYLLGEAAANISTAIHSAGVTAECEIARAIGEGPVDGFGATDCDCPSHLAFDRDGSTLLDAILAAHRGYGQPELRDVGSMDSERV